MGLMEKHFAELLDRMTPEKREAYKSLVNTFPEESCGPLTGICGSNSIVASLAVFVKWKNLRSSFYDGVCENISRVNHRLELFLIWSRSSDDRAAASPMPSAHLT